MAGKLHCVKNQGRTDKICSPTHPEVSFFYIPLRVPVLFKHWLGMYPKQNKTKGLFENAFDGMVNRHR